MQRGADLWYFVYNFCSYYTQARPVSKSWGELMCITSPSWHADLLKSLAQPDFVFVVAAVDLLL